jgi:2Fe-2S ferredoxin
MTKNQITLRNLNNTILDSKDNSKSVLNIIHEHGIDWMFACGGKGKCTTCKIIVQKGMNNISEANEIEKKFLEIGKLEPNERLACQCTISGDIEVDVADKNKFPHMTYSN